MSTLDRIKKLCEQHGISVPILEDRLEIPNNTIYQWKSGNRKPGTERLEKVADYFNVSVDYLLGRTDEIYSSNDNEFDEKTRSLARDFQDLDIESQDLLQSLIKTMNKRGRDAKGD